MAILDNFWKNLAKESKKKVVFIRAKREGEKLHYIGYVTKATRSLYCKVQINSWLFRFGGFKEVRYYNPKTKKCVGIWTLEKHDKYCEEHHYNDTVFKDNNYFTLVEKKKFNNDIFKKDVVKEEKNETLREVLDRIGVKPGDDRGFILQELFKSTVMNVSRRYIECDTWSYLLDKKVVGYEECIDIWGHRTTKFYLG